ncbi:MAG: hypothetical protein VW443_02950 [Pseudomonadales bacterium]
MSSNRKQNIVNLTDIQNTFDQVPDDNDGNKTSFEKTYPDFLEACNQTIDCVEWSYALGVCEFMLEKQSASGYAYGSALFWQESKATQVLFYLLLRSFIAAIQVKSSRVGVTQKEALAWMKHASKNTEKTCKAIINRGIADGYIHETTWRIDQRAKLLALTPLSISEYMNRGVETHILAVAKSRLVEKNINLDEQRNEDLGPTLIEVGKKHK